MNTSSHSTGAPAPAIDPALPKFGTTDLIVDVPHLRRMSAKELLALGSALQTVSHVLAGIACQPRLGERNYNLAGDVIETINDFLGTYRETIVKIAAESKPIDPKDVDARWWTILQFEADMEDDLGDLALSAVTASTELAAAEYRAAHTRPGGAA
jgi:hypothetical protein